MLEKESDGLKPVALSPINPGPVPSDWQIRTIGSVSHKVTNGFVGSSLPHQVEEGVTYLQGFNVRPSRIELKNRTFVSPEFHSANTKSQLKSGDVLVVQSGHIGTAARVPDNFGEANCHALIIVDLDRERVVPDYLVEHLNSAIGRARMRGLHVGSSMLHINTSELAEYRLPLPPLPEQRKIAEILRTWDEAIEKLEALRAAKEQQFRGLQQKLIDQDFKSYGDTLEQYALIPNLEKITSVDGLRPLTVKLHCKGIMANGRNAPVTLSDKGRPYYRRKAGDFLIGRQNFHNGGFGIVPPELNGFIASNAITSLRIDSSKADVHYLFYFFSRKDYYLRIGHIMDGTGQKELSDKQIRKLPVSIPSLEKQVEVVKILNAANEEISLIDTKIEAITRQKRGLMQKLLTGEWRVKVESD